MRTRPAQTPVARWVRRSRTPRHPSSTTRQLTSMQASPRRLPPSQPPNNAPDTATSPAEACPSRDRWAGCPPQASSAGRQAAPCGAGWCLEELLRIKPHASVQHRLLHMPLDARACAPGITACVCVWVCVRGPHAVCQLRYRATVAVWYPSLAPSTSILWVATGDGRTCVRGVMTALGWACRVSLHSGCQRQEPGLHEELNAWFEVPEVPAFPPPSQQQGMRACSFAMPGPAGWPAGGTAEQAGGSCRRGGLQAGDVCVTGMLQWGFGDHKTRTRRAQGCDDGRWMIGCSDRRCIQTRALVLPLRMLAGHRRFHATGFSVTPDSK